MPKNIYFVYGGDVIWRRDLTQHLSAPTNVSSIAAIIVSFSRFFRAPGIRVAGGPPDVVFSNQMTYSSIVHTPEYKLLSCSVDSLND